MPGPVLRSPSEGLNMDGTLFKSNEDVHHGAQQIIKDKVTVTAQTEI